MAPRPMLGTLVLSTGLYSLMQSLTVPAVPVMQRELGSGQAEATWVLTAFLLSASVATPIVGRLGDAQGLRKYLLISLSALLVGSVVAAMANSMAVLIAARVIQGLSGGIVPLSFGIIRSTLGIERVPGAIAMIAALLSIAQAVGIVFAGIVVEVLGFRWLFVIPAILACASIAAVPFAIPRSRPQAGQPLNVWSGVLLAGWLVLLLLGVTEAPDWGWSSARFLLMLGGAAILWCAWLLTELRAAAPLVDLRLMASRSIAGANLVTLLIGISMFGSFGFLPQLLQTSASSGYGLGISVAGSGLVMLPACLTSFCMGMAAVRLMHRWGERVMIATGCLASAAGLAILAFSHDHLWQIYFANSLSNAGIGLVFACLANVVVLAAPKESASMATAINSNIRTIGGALGTAIFTTTLVAEALPSGYPAERGYILGFLLLAVASGLAAVASMLITAPRQAHAAHFA